MIHGLQPKATIRPHLANRAEGNRKVREDASNIPNNTFTTPNPVLL